MGIITIHLNVLRQPHAILKLILAVSSIIALALHRSTAYYTSGLYGFYGPLFYSIDEVYFYIGTMMTYILVPLTLFFCYLLGQNPAIQEIFLAIVGFVFLLADGIIIAKRYHDLYHYRWQNRMDQHAAVACAVFTFLSCFICLLDAAIIFWKRRHSG